MSRRGFVGSSGTYNVRASELARELKTKTFQCTTYFLDDSQQDFVLEKKSKGEVLLDLIFQHLELVERDYFGVQFQETDGMRWLDATKSVRKQIKKPPYIVYFRVKFYVSDPSKLQEEYTRYHYFLQLKKDIREGRLAVPISTSVLLASYAVQSEIGDYNPDEHGHGYLADLQYLPNQTEEMERKIMELHKLHKGQTPADAEFNFLDHAKRLDMYGVDLHKARVRDATNAEIQLGVTAVGLVVFQNGVKINTFSWAKIVKISFKRKQFFIQLKREAHESYDSLLGFNMLSYHSSKVLWKSCVEHHSFFRLNAPRPTIKKFFFMLGSKFRYSGRTEYQTVEEGKKSAYLERTFVRSPSKCLIRQTVPIISRDGMEEKKYLPLSKPLARLNGTNSHIRPYDSFNNKVVSSTSKEPRKAWTEKDFSDDDGGFRVPSRESTAFTPLLSTKIGFVDEEESISEVQEPADYAEPQLGSLENGGVTGFITIHMKPDEQGKFGFNVKGGTDQSMPIIVSRVAPHTPADRSIPRLNEGDQVLRINSKDVSGLLHEQVVQLIRSCREPPNKELILVVKPNVYVAEEIEEPPFQYVPDVPQVVPRVDALSESMLLLGDSLENGAAIAQFEILYRKKPGMMCSVSKLPENASKNRYRDILPYDSTRVILRGGFPVDYINASHVNMKIPTSGIVNRYIAAQGPLPNTCGDFWQMIWEQQSTLIVMLTTVLERGRVKCHQYWPELHTSTEYGHLKVTCTKEQEGPSFAFRDFSLVNMKNNEERHITHMQYIAWPDHGVPEDSSDFLDFVFKVRQNRTGIVDATVVHCSAGIGRTGVLILMETAICLIEANEPVYPLDIVKSMRDQRAMLIQNASQYRFVCEAILKVYNEKIVTPLHEYQR
ncbi:hypothetical protein CHUAL_007419 [Chamberlinius hualienensis]